MYTLIGQSRPVTRSMTKTNNYVERPVTRSMTNKSNNYTVVSRRPITRSLSLKINII